MDILLKPIITEKFSAMSAKGRYAFVVRDDANKIQIKTAVEKTYGVTVESVNTMKYVGKMKYRYTKSRIIEGRVKQAKRAIVTLKQGDTIDLYGNI